VSDEASAVPRPAPVLDDETAAFWQGSIAGRLVLQRCRQCGAVQHYPRWTCTTCHSSDLEDMEASGEGTVYTRTIVRQAHIEPFKSMVPYVVALIELDEGPRMMSNVVGCGPEDVKIGARVRVLFEPVSDDAAVPLFELAPDPAAND
jgi:uncharacterized protein